MPLRAVIFDLDGTLLDTLADIAGAANEVLRRRGLPEHSPEAYKQFIGEGVNRLFERALPAGARTSEMIAACAAGFRESYAAGWNRTTHPYDGISKLLETLAARGIPMAVLSNKPHAFTVQCVEHYFPHVHFAAIAGERPDVPRKPDPAGARIIAADLGLPPDEIVFLGDSAIDMQTATSAGIFAVGASWGFRSVAELRNAGAKRIIDQPGELFALFVE